MRQEIEAICEELISLQQEGISRIYIEDQTLRTLEAVSKKIGNIITPKVTQNTSPQDQIKDYNQSTLNHNPSTQNPTPTPPAPYQSKRTPTSVTLPATNETLFEIPNENPSSHKVNSTTESNSTIPKPTAFQLPEGDKQSQWEWLRDKVLNCAVCNSHVKPGKKVVFGVGNINADIFFCGEAPGADEEIEGEPFVGKAGQLLTKIIQAMGLQRSDVYIGNIMNWRPETGTAFGNRPPTQQEMNFCLPYLKAQLDIVKPKVIVALGNTAVSGLLGPDPKRRMTDIRGNWLEFEGIPLMATYHPSYLLRNNTMRAKRQVWEDMLQAMERIGMKISDKQKRFFSE